MHKKSHLKWTGKYEAMTKRRFEGPLKPGMTPDLGRFEGSLPGHAAIPPGRIRVPRQPITNPRDLLPAAPKPAYSEEKMKAEWKKLSKAYDYGSNDKRISLAQFRAVWKAAREN